MIKIQDSPLYLLEKAYATNINNDFVKSVEKFYVARKFMTPKQIQALKNIGNSKRRRRSLDDGALSVGRFLGFDVTRKWSDADENDDRWNDPDFDGYDYYGIPNTD